MPIARPRPAAWPGTIPLWLILVALLLHAAPAALAQNDVQATLAQVKSDQTQALQLIGRGQSEQARALADRVQQRLGAVEAGPQQEEDLAGAWLGQAKLQLQIENPQAADAALRQMKPFIDAIRPKKFDNASWISLVTQYDFFRIRADDKLPKPAPAAPARNDVPGTLAQVNADQVQAFQLIFRGQAEQAQPLIDRAQERLGAVEAGPQQEQDLARAWIKQTKLQLQIENPQGADAALKRIKAFIDGIRPKANENLLLRSFVSQYDVYRGVVDAKLPKPAAVEPEPAPAAPADAPARPSAEPAPPVPQLDPQAVAIQPLLEQSAAVLGDTQPMLRSPDYVDRVQAALDEVAPLLDRAEQAAAQVAPAAAPDTADPNAAAPATAHPGVLALREVHDWIQREADRMRLMAAAKPDEVNQRIENLITQATEGMLAAQRAMSTDKARGAVLLDTVGEQLRQIDALHPGDKNYLIKITRTSGGLWTRYYAARMHAPGEEGRAMQEQLERVKTIQQQVQPLLKQHRLAEASAAMDELRPVIEQLHARHRHYLFVGNAVYGYLAQRRHIAINIGPTLAATPDPAELALPDLAQLVESESNAAAGLAAAQQFVLAQKTMDQLKPIAQRLRTLGQGGPEASGIASSGLIAYDNARGRIEQLLPKPGAADAEALLAKAEQLRELVRAANQQFFRASFDPDALGRADAALKHAKPLADELRPHESTPKIGGAVAQYDSARRTVDRAMKQ